MNNILVFTDLHIKESELTECSLVTDEILSLAKEYKVDTIFNIGDTFDRIFPSPKEQDFFADFVNKLPCLMNTIIASSHESISETNTVLTHYSILDKKVKLYPNEWTDSKTMFAHWIFKESKKGFGCKRSIKDFKHLNLWLGGHQHTFEELSEKHYQLGSCRSINFDESEDTKYICIITDYGKKTQNKEFIALKSSYPMQTVIFQKSLIVGLPNTILSQCRAKFWVLTPKIQKTRYLFKDLESYKEFIPYEKEVKEYYEKFKIDFDLDKKEFVFIEKKDNINIRDNLEEFFKQNKTEEKIANIIRGVFKYKKI